MERFQLWFRMRLLNLLLISRKGVEGSVVLFVFFNVQCIVMLFCLGRACPIQSWPVFGVI